MARHIVHLHHGKLCPYCNNPMSRNKYLDPEKLTVENPCYPTMDHLYPRSKFGRGLQVIPNVIIVCCNKCNNDKADHLIEDWFLVLRQKNDPRALVVFRFIEKHKKKLNKLAKAVRFGSFLIEHKLTHNMKRKTRIELFNLWDESNPAALLLALTTVNQ